MGEPEEEENLSGAFDAEEQQWQEMLAADAGYKDWSEYMDAIYGPTSRPTSSEDAADIAFRKALFPQRLF